MSDELTPEEKAAFESLPRERMPAGLEAKVVDAMRDHGFLAKRRRVIELSRGRVAGVLAASVALVIVGYSLGLHEGRGREMFVPTTTPEPERKYTELAAPPTTSEADKDRQVESPAPELGRAAPKNEPATDAVAPSEERQALKKESAPTPAPATAPASRRDEYVAPQSEGLARASEMHLRAKRVQDELTRSLQEPKQRAESALQSTARTQAPSASMGAYSLSKPKEAVTLLWGGDAYEIQADSVRVVEDESGRTLHIYTSQGIIRIRLAE